MSCEVVPAQPVDATPYNHLILQHTSDRESIRMAVLNQNLNGAFDLFELTPANGTGFLDFYGKTLSKCCIDPLRPPGFSECENGPACQVPITLFVRQSLAIKPRTHELSFIPVMYSSW
jgi:hypothetical protein